MRIGLLATAWRGEASGAGRRLLEIARRLPERGHDPVLFVPRALPAHPLESSPGLRFVRLPIPPAPTALRALAQAAILPRAVAEARVDVVATDAVPALRVRDLPLVLTIHDLRAFASYPGAPRLRRRIAGLVYGRAIEAAAAVVAVSNATAEEIERRLGFPRERVRVVPNAADHLGLPPDVPQGRHFLHVGHVEPRKNLSTAVRALARLNAPLLRLVLAGAERSREARRLRSLAGSLGLADRLEIRGPVAEGELPRLYAGAVACIFPSWIEGFGIPLLEALRCGAAVFASAIPAHREVAGDAAAFFDPEDPVALADILRGFLTEDLEHRGVRERAQAARFSWDATADGFLDACRSVAR